MRDLRGDPLYNLLQKCIRTKDLDVGRQIHSQLIFIGLDTCTLFGDQTIRFFSLCGSLLEASLCFHKINEASLRTWNTIISAIAQSGKATVAVSLFYDMEERYDIKPDQMTFLSILKAFSSSGAGALEHFRMIHHRVIRDGLETDVALGSTFVDLYAKQGSMEEAFNIFRALSDSNVVSWGAMITVCAQNKEDYLALQLFEQMQEQGITPGRVVFLGTLKACGHAMAIEEGRTLHHEIVRSGLLGEQSILNSLIDMYAKCKSVKEASTVFDTMQTRDVVTWSAMLTAYVENGESLRVFDLFRQCQCEGIEPDKVMFVCILKACCNTRSIEMGNILHKQIQYNGLESDTLVANALVDMYAKCGKLENARAIFDKMRFRQLVSWGAMITGYAQSGYGILAFEIFHEMQHQGIEPNDVVLLGVLKASSSIGSIKQGQLVHEFAVQRRLESDLVITNAVIDMYMKFWRFEDASIIFQKMAIRDVISWSGMISGYAQCGQHEVAGHYLEEMIIEGVRPDEQIFTTLLTACCHIGLLEEGRNYFRLMKHCGITPGVIHYNCIIDLLSRTGQLDEAENVLQSTPAGPDAIGWMSVLTNWRTYGQTHLGIKI